MKIIYINHKGDTRVVCATDLNSACREATASVHSLTERTAIVSSNDGTVLRVYTLDVVNQLTYHGPL